MLGLGTKTPVTDYPVVATQMQLHNRFLKVTKDFVIIVASRWVKFVSRWERGISMKSVVSSSTSIS